jgi:C1A family cysteine protease
MGQSVAPLEYLLVESMGHFVPRGLGWLPSLPDFRDYTPASALANELLTQLRDIGGAGSPRAASVDLREYFLDVDDQLTLNASSACACAGLAEYFQRRANGRLLQPSRLFLYQNALRLAGHQGDIGVDLRTAIKAMVRCGIPPEHYWPYEVDRFAAQPDPFLYSFVDPYQSLQYVRLDSHESSGAENLQMVKTFLSAGFPSAFGFSVPTSLSLDADIPYRPTFDSIRGGQAMLAVGYDDRWLRGSRGALLVRSSWGAEWGDGGYGWLPYAFVEERLALEFWSFFHDDWIASGEFDMPELPQ